MPVSRGSLQFLMNLKGFNLNFHILAHMCPGTGLCGDRSHIASPNHSWAQEPIPGPLQPLGNSGGESSSPLLLPWNLDWASFSTRNQHLTCLCASLLRQPFPDVPYPRLPRSHVTPPASGIRPSHPYSHPAFCGHFGQGKSTGNSTRASRFPAEFSEVAGIVVSISDTPSLSWQVPLAPPLSPNIYTMELCLSCLHPALCPGPPPLSYQIQAFPAPHPFPNPSHGLPDPTHFPFLTLSLFLCPSQSWWTLPGKESLNLWYDCTWNNDNKTWACSTVSENGKGHQGLV